MSRINIEDCLLEDSRFISCCVKLKSKEKTIGHWVLIAKLAQSYWKINKSLIPYPVYEWNKFPTCFVESGLVEKRIDGYYLRGSEKYFAWILSQVQNGKMGGRPVFCEKKDEIYKNSDTSQKKEQALQVVETKDIRLTHGLTHEEPTANLPSPSPTPTQIQNTERERGDKKKNERFEIIASLKCIDDVFHPVIERMTEEQQKKLIDAYSLPVITSYIKQIGGWKKYNTVKDVYMTVIKWATRDGVRNQVEWKKQQDLYNKKLEEKENQKC